MPHLHPRAGDGASELDTFEFFLGVYSFCALPQGDFLLNRVQKLSRVINLDI